MKAQIMRHTALAAALILLAACSGGGSPTGSGHSPSPVTGALTGGLIAFIGDPGVGVVDPLTGKSTIVAPLPAGGAFRVSGPVWGPAPGLAYPVIYFTIHDERPAERRTAAGVVPYDWVFRVDPFTGAVDPMAASYDFQSEGPFGLAASSHYLALTVGCCSSYEVDALDLTQAAPTMKVLAKPPNQAALFTEGAAPGIGGLIAVRAFATGAWYWLNADAGVLNPFPLALGPDDGPIAISADGTLAAVSRPNQGAVVIPINVTAPEASPSASASASASAAAAPSPSPSAPRASGSPRPVNSTHTHVEDLAWSHDAKQLVLAVNGELQIYNSSAPDGTGQTGKFPAGPPGLNITGVDWSGPIPDRNLGMVKAGAGPQAAVDALLDSTKLPAAADSSSARPLTKVYMWQYDSSKPSPIASITDATPAVLQQYPPLAAGVVFHHWAPLGTWGLLGGCYRYRVVITGSVPPVASTFGLGSNTPCNAPASPSSTASAAPTPSK